jgi:hypothetical protein
MLTSPRRTLGAQLVAAGAFGMLAASAAFAQPANNTCANAIPIGNSTVTGTTIGSTNDGTAGCGNSNSNGDVWYRYTAPATTTITVTTCNPGTNYDSVLSVHSAACPASTATQIACNDDEACPLAGFRSTLTFNAIAGTEYLIRVSGFASNVGTFELSVGPGGGGQPPANDACASATAIGNGSFAGTTNNAAADGQSSCVGSATPDVYYLYTAPAAGTVHASTCTAANYDTVISVHSACPATTANQIACNDNSCNVRSQVSFEAAAGQQYVIRVAGATASGTFTLTMGEPPAPAGGPDVTYQHVNGFSNSGAVGGIRAYALGSDTCNIGDENLLWTNAGTPALAMNAYRLHNGRLVQIGLGFAKTACCAGATSGCGSCNGAGGAVLGAGCKDVYGAGYNANQPHLAPRSAINGFSAIISPYPQTSGDAIFRRLQIAQSDMTTSTFTGARFFAEGAYMATDDAASGNAMNNNSYMIVNIDQSSFNMSSASGTFQGIPAIRAWRDHGLGNNVVDPSVGILSVDVPQEGRFWVATKVTDLGNGSYLYDYAIYNMNSDRSGGSLTVPRAAGVNVSGVGFHDVNYHSGEPYDNTDWTSSVNASTVEWRSPQTFAQNPNSNALRWGTMYNYWFTADTAPTTGTVTLGLFKPGTPTEVAFDVLIPSAGTGCQADFDGNTVLNVADIFAFLAAWFASDPSADIDGVPGIGVPDIFSFLSLWFAGCP